MLEVAGARELKRALMQYGQHQGGDGEFFTAEGYPLREGLRAGFYDITREASC